MSAKKQAVKTPAKKAAAKVANKTAPAKKAVAVKLPKVSAVPTPGKPSKQKQVSTATNKPAPVFTTNKVQTCPRVIVTNKPAPLRANHGSLEGDVIKNGVCYPRPNTKKMAMWKLIEKVQGKSTECPERFRVMEAMHEANEKLADGAKFKTYSFALEYHWFRTFHGVAGDRVKLYKKRGSKSKDQGELPLGDKPVKVPKLPPVPKAKESPAKPAVKVPAKKAASKAPKAPAVPPVPPVAPPIPALPV